MTQQNFTVWCNLAEEALKSCQYQQALKYYDLALKIRQNIAVEIKFRTFKIGKRVKY